MSKSFGVDSTTLPNDNLLAGSHPPVTIPITIASGQNLVCGTVLGKVTETGYYVAYDNDASDGSQTAVAILMQDTDATSGAEKSAAYVHGEFNEDELTGLDTAGQEDLLARGIYVKSIS